MEAANVRARINQITGPYGDEVKADAGGPRSFLSLFLSDLPDCCCDINSLQVRLASRAAAITFIGPPQPGDWRQINIQVPSDAPPGPTPVRAFWHGHAISDSAHVEIAARPALQPRIVSVTDGRDILSNGEIVTEWFQITLLECVDIDRLRVSVAGHSVEQTGAFRADPLIPRHVVNCRLPADVPNGRQTVQAWLGNLELRPVEVEISRGV